MLQVHRHQAPQARALSIGIVAAIHAAAILALISGLSPKASLEPHHSGPIDVRVDAPRAPAPPTSPPPIPTTMIVPRSVPVPHPVVSIAPQSGVMPTAVERPGGEDAHAAPVPAGPASIFVPARGIAGTHTIPAYPVLAVRLNEQGVVRLALSIDEHGTVVGARVLASSGHDLLDSAAIAWVESRWRYEPAMRNGKPVPTTMEAVVTFRLNGRG